MFWTTLSIKSPVTNYKQVSLVRIQIHIVNTLSHNTLQQLKPLKADVFTLHAHIFKSLN